MAFCDEGEAGPKLMIANIKKSLVYLSCVIEYIGCFNLDKAYIDCITI